MPMGREIRQALKDAKKSGKSTEWSQSTGGNSKVCQGCKKPFDRMSAKTLKEHAAFLKSGRVKDCPDI